MLSSFVEVVVVYTWCKKLCKGVAENLRVLFRKSVEVVWKSCGRFVKDDVVWRSCAGRAAFVWTCCRNGVDVERRSCKSCVNIVSRSCESCANVVGLCRSGVRVVSKVVSKISSRETRIGSHDTM